MKRLILSVVGLMMIAGCGADTNVDARCQAGAPCQTMVYWQGKEYWTNNVPHTTQQTLAALGSGDPDTYWTTKFENWYYTGKE